MKNYLVVFYSARPKDNPEYLELLQEAIGPNLVWDIIDPVCGIVLVRSKLDAQELGKNILKYLQPGDKLLVTEVHVNSAWYGLTPSATARRYLRRLPLQTASDSPPQRG